MKKGKKTKTLCFSFTDQIEDRIIKAANNLERGNKSQLIEKILVEWLKKNGY